MANIKDELAKLGIGKSTSSNISVNNNIVNEKAIKLLDLKDKLDTLIVQTENVINAVSSLEEIVEKLSEELSNVKAMTQELKG